MEKHEPVTLYFCSIEDFVGLPDGGLLPPSRSKALRAFKQPEDQARCLVGGLLLRHVLNIADDSGIRYNAQGKPYLSDNTQYFSLSHSGTIVVLAVARVEIGADIEQIVPYTEDIKMIARRVFTTPERDWLERQGGDEGFCTLWTAKESIMKGTGLGFALSPEQFSVLPIDSGPHFISGQTWYFWWHCRDGHMICVAAPHPPVVTVEELKYNDLCPDATESERAIT